MCPLFSATGTSLVSSSSACLPTGVHVVPKGVGEGQRWVVLACRAISNGLPSCPIGMVWRVLSLPAAPQYLPLVSGSPCLPPWACTLQGPPAGRGSPAKLRQHRQQGVMHPGILSLASAYSASSNSHFDPAILSGKACVWDCPAEPNQLFSCRGRFLVTPPWGGCGLQPVSQGIS